MRPFKPRQWFNEASWITGKEQIVSSGKSDLATLVSASETNRTGSTYVLIAFKNETA
jgi:hypothetical protein